jgi:hypothetical protein
VSEGPVISPVPGLRSRLSPTQFEGFVENIRSSIHEASPKQRDVGRNLFDQVNAQAQYMGRNRGGLHRAAGIIAATSVQTNWDQNMAAAHHVLKSKPGEYNDEDEKFGNMHQMHKARLIQEGHDPLDVLRGPKERSFFQNIVDPRDPHPVTIDRHAHDAAVRQKFGEARRGLRSIQRYGILQDAYKEAGSREGMLGNQAQSIAWLRQTGREHIADPDRTRPW